MRFGLPTDRWLLVTLLAGVALRLAVFAVLRPNNNDPHYAVVEYIVAHRAVPPTADSMMQSYHPPLYYLFAAPFAAARGEKGAQVISLACSLLTLWLLAHVVATTELIRSRAARRHALAFAAFLPQFVLFGLFVSNDSLSYLVGAATFAAGFALVDRPSLSTLLDFAAITGVGLLTKGTFIAFAPLALALVAVAAWRRRLPATRQLAALAIFAATAGTIGAYKFVRNYRELGRPVMHSMDFNPTWLPSQQGAVRGVRSFVDADVSHLVRQPFEEERTHHSIPLMMYATTWYQYIIESNLTAVHYPPWTFVASLLCLAGLLPTALALVGTGSLALRARATLRAPPDEQSVARLEKSAFAVALFAATAAIVLAAGIKFDAWTCFQGRLLFPALLGALLPIVWGYDALGARSPALRRSLDAALVAGYLVFLLYFAVELREADPEQLEATREMVRG